MTVKARSQCAIFRSTCLATPFLKTFSRYETSRFTDVTLSNVSCNLSRFHDDMRLKEYFHWLLPQTVATQVAGQMLHCATLKKFVASVAESRHSFYTFRNGFCNWPRNVFGRYTELCYIDQ